MTEDLNCNMRQSAGVPCQRPVTHIGAKGWLYCDHHAPERRGWEATRRLRKWELDLLAAGKPVPSYKPISRAEYLARQVSA